MTKDEAAKVLADWLNNQNVKFVLDTSGLNEDCYYEITTTFSTEQRNILQEAVKVIKGCE